MVHGLAIGRNMPLPMLAATLARLGDFQIIEWVPRQDPMVRMLLATREDVFLDYSENGSPQPSLATGSSRTRVPAGARPGPVQAARLDAFALQAGR